MPRYIDEKDVYALVEPRGIAKVHCSQIDELPRADVVPRAELDILKSTITQKEEEAYNKGYADAAREIFEEIEKIMLDGEIGGKYLAKVINPEKYVELKQTHIEQCPNCKHFIGCEEAIWVRHCDDYDRNTET